MSDVCFHCDDEAWLDVAEVWPLDRAFTLTGCCADNVEDWTEEIPGWDKRAFASWFESRTGFFIKAVRANDHVMRLDFGIRLGPVTLKKAKAFVLEHHRHNKPPCGWRFGLGCYNGSELIGVAMVGRPVARMLDHTTIVEVTRLCIKPMEVARLSFNACSMLYAACAREAKKRGFKKIISYTLESERGSSLKAVGWTPEAKTRGGSWNRPSRARTDKAPTCPKVRWAKDLR